MKEIFSLTVVFKNIKWKLMPQTRKSIKNRKVAGVTSMTDALYKIKEKIMRPKYNRKFIIDFICLFSAKRNKKISCLLKTKLLPKKCIFFLILI